MCKLDFIDWILDLEEYLIIERYVMKKEEVRLVSNKLDDDAAKWWDNNIEIDKSIEVSIKFVLGIE